MTVFKAASDEHVPVSAVPAKFCTQPFVPEVPTRMLPTTARVVAGLVVPMPTLPAEVIVRRAVLFVPKISGAFADVPMFICSAFVGPPVKMAVFQPVLVTSTMPAWVPFDNVTLASAAVPVLLFSI